MGERLAGDPAPLTLDSAIGSAQPQVAAPGPEARDGGSPLGIGRENRQMTAPSESIGCRAGQRVSPGDEGITPGNLRGIRRTRSHGFNANQSAASCGST